jgi:hypothetical protein
MGKIGFFSIVLEKSNGVYFPGDPVVGQVTIRVFEDFKINSVYMVLNGESRVKW